MMDRYSYDDINSLYLKCQRHRDIFVLTEDKWRSRAYVHVIMNTYKGNYNALIVSFENYEADLVQKKAAINLYKNHRKSNY